MWEGRGVYRILLRKPRGNKGNIEMDLMEVGCGGMDWIELAQGRDSWQALANALMNRGFP